MLRNLLIPGGDLKLCFASIAKLVNSTWDQLLLVHIEWPNGTEEYQAQHQIGLIIIKVRNLDPWWTRAGLDRRPDCMCILLCERHLPDHYH